MSRANSDDSVAMTTGSKHFCYYHRWWTARVVR